MRHILLFVCCIAAFSTLQAQGTQQTFGKNRVQHHRDFDDWSEYESERCVTYWYGQSRNIGQTAAQIAESDYDEIQKLLEYRLTDKVEILVYADITDLHQSNIGAEEVLMSTTGQTKIVGNKLFIHFDGNHEHLRREVREGLATVFLNNMIFGATLQEIVQNAVSLNLPEWFKVGLVTYVGNEWDADADNQLRDVFNAKRYKTFDRFAAADPKLAGHAFWYFIAQQFGKSGVSNLLYLTRINRSIEESFQYALGGSYEGIAVACMQYYEKRYDAERNALKLSNPKMTGLKVKNRFKALITNVKISPDGKSVAYVQNEIGRYKVYIQDIKSGKRTLILKDGAKNPFQATDYNYPLIAWNPDNQRFMIVFERRDVVKYLFYDLKTKKKQIQDFGKDYQRVYSAEFMNPKDLLISAAVRGFSDLYIFNVNNQQSKTITNDFWDDLDATVVNVRGKKGIVWASNRLSERLSNERLDSIIPTNHMDLFYKDLEDTAKTIVRVTNTPDASERQPMAVDSTYFSFISDESGIANRQSARLETVLDYSVKVILLENKDSIVIAVDSVLSEKDMAKLKIDTIVQRDYYKTIAIVHNNSNRERNILTQHSAPRVGQAVELTYLDQKPIIKTFAMTPDTAITPTFTVFWQLKQRDRNKKTRPAAAPSRFGALPPATKPEPIAAPTLKPMVDSTPPTPAVAETPKRDTSKKKVNIDTYVFQSEFDEKETPKTTEIRGQERQTPAPQIVAKRQDEPAPVPPTAAVNNNIGVKLPQSLDISDGEDAPKKHVFRQNRITPYRLKFRSDFLTFTPDNSPLFGGLENYAGQPASGFATPPIGLLMKGNFKDLLEDYQLEGGIRIPISLNGYEAFAFFDDRKHQLDRRYAIYHRSTRFTENGNTPSSTFKSRSQSTIAQYEVRYPFDIFTSLRATGTMRFDQFTNLATDTITLRTPQNAEQRLGLKVEYVFDNTMDLGINLKSGTRYKAYAEYIKKFNIDLVNNVNLSFDKGDMLIVGVDARHYERLDKHSIFAVRFAGAMSFGSEQMLYILGGLDNSIGTSYNTDIKIPNGNYAYQALAANLRGFNQNIRNGTSYALINAELRMPVFRYFSERPLKSTFFRNFQLIGFFDVGTAWHGASPFKDNPLNVLEIDNAPSIYLKVNYFKDPLVAGFGLGARAMVLGYMLRFDYGWGIETRQIQKPRLSFALGYDF